MKDVLVGIMVKMMPFMMPVMWIGGVAVVAGLALLMLLAITGGGRGGVRWAGGIALSVGAFFIACQIAGYALGVPPSINFGDSRKFEFLLVPFWQVGLAILVPGLLIGWFGRQHEAGV